jgi:hypothetical protein
MNRIANNLDKYIVTKINTHFLIHRIKFSTQDTIDIIGYINKGIYAFQLIYDENNDVSEIKPLDYRKISSKPYRSIKYTPNNLLYSYVNDYKYSQCETLIFDIDTIRDIKLEEILNKDEKNSTSSIN